MLKKIILLGLLVSSLLSNEKIDLNINGNTYTVNLEEMKHLSELSNSAVFFYKGRLEADANSWVRLSFENRKWVGTAYAFGELYEIDQASEIMHFQAASNGFFQPAAQITENVQSKKMDLSALQGKSCAVGGSISNVQGTSVKASMGFAPSFVPSIAQAGSPTVLDLEIVLDHFFVQESGGKANAITKAIGIINSLDGVYTQEFGISINLVNIELYENDASDPISNVTNSSALLNEVVSKGNSGAIFKKNVSSLEHLITGRSIDGNVLGVAYVGVNCNGPQSYAFSQSFGSQTFLVMGHEIGHSLGADHDSVSPGNGSACGSGYIMFPSITGADRFSSCSKTSMFGNGLSSNCVKEVVNISVEQVDSALTRLEQDRIVNESYIIKNLSNSSLNGFSLNGSFSSNALELTSVSIGGNNCSGTTSSYSCTIGTINALSSKVLNLQFKAKSSSGNVAFSHEIIEPFDTFADVELANNELSNVYTLESILAPSALSFVSQVDKIALTWNDNSSIETQYEVHRSLNNSSWNIIATLAPGSQQYTDTNINIATVYFYRVSAKNSTRTSNYSNTIQATVDKMQKPQNFRLTRIN